MHGPTVRKTLDHEAQEFLTEELGKKWKTAQNPKARLAEVLQMAAQSAGLKGNEMVDTMKYGTDFWRGGKFLSESVAMTEFASTTLLRRFETLCQAKSLLDRFREDPDFSFDQYSHAYVQQLQGQDCLRFAAVHIVFSIAQDRLPVFYCTEPSIPGYRILADQAGLRVPGCHRVPLVAAISDFFCHWSSVRSNSRTGSAERKSLDPSSQRQLSDGL